jgi:ectoine hydroxylase-related dioxygenase (phytanoyl-CoA dioxygenase family)
MGSNMVSHKFGHMVGKMTTLTSNGYTLSTAPERLGRLEPTDAATPMGKLKEKYREQGYLWLKGFFDRDEVLDFRRHFFNAFAGTGLLKPGTDPLEGIYGGDEKQGEVQKILMQFARTAAFESFCLQPRLWRFYDEFLAGPSYLHKRKIIRYAGPGKGFTTPAHYDLIYLRGGTDRVSTSWIPIGDAPVEMGGLLYLEGSDVIGRKMEREFAERNAELSPEERISAYNRNMAAGGWVGKNLPEMAERFNSRWLMADYEAGDMVVHSAYMIHAASDNVDPLGRIRLSTDIRYQNVKDEIDARWSNHWSLDDML